MSHFGRALELLLLYAALPIIFFPCSLFVVTSYITMLLHKMQKSKVTPISCIDLPCHHYMLC